MKLLQDLPRMLGYNLGIMAVYILGFKLVSLGSDEALGAMIFSAMCMALHVGVLALFLFVYTLEYFYKGKKPEMATAALNLLITGVAVLLIGFPACFATASINL